MSAARPAPRVSDVVVSATVAGVVIAGGMVGLVYATWWLTYLAYDWGASDEIQAVLLSAILIVPLAGALGLVGVLPLRALGHSGKRVTGSAFVAHLLGAAVAIAVGLVGYAARWTVGVFLPWILFPAIGCLGTFAGSSRPSLRAVAVPVTGAALVEGLLMNFPLHPDLLGWDQFIVLVALGSVGMWVAGALAARTYLARGSQP